MAELLSIPQGTLNCHLKNQKALEESDETDRKRKRTSKVPLVDEAVKEWIQQSLSRGADFISGQIVREKADEFARKLGVEDDWKSSEGWLIRFWCTKNCMARLQMRMLQKKKIGLQQCGQDFSNNMARRTFLMLTKQASTFALCLTQR